MLTSPYCKDSHAWPGKPHDSASPSSPYSLCCLRRPLRRRVGDITLTQSISQTIANGNSVSCNNSNGHTDNSYYRVFDIPAATYPNGFTVSSVEFGVEQATSTAGSQPVEVKLYTLNGALNTANMTQIVTAKTVITPQNAIMVSVPVPGSVPANGKLVVEVFSPNGQSVGNRFFIGSNSAGQSAPSYISAPDCGISQPIDLTSIGFPNMHIVMNVVGTAGAKSAQTIAFGALAGKTYGDAPFTISATASSGLEVSFSSTTSTICSVDSASVTILASGTCTIAADQAGDATYNPAPQVSRSFTVAKAELTIAADNVSKVYGATNPTLTAIYTGFVNGDDVADLDTPPTLTSDATPASPAGTYPITASGGQDNNYSFVYQSGALTVSAKDVPALAWGDPAAITYGTALGTAQLNAGATFNGNAVPGSFSYNPPLSAFPALRTPSTPSPSPPAR